jgi:ADP-ribose pyrophosphatase
MEKLIDSKSVFLGSFLEVIKDTVELPNGKHATREYINHPGAVAIIAITNDNKIVLEYQYRHSVEQIILEIPAGKLDPQEQPLDAAKRELQEETGFSSTSWTCLGECLPCIGYSNERIIYYLAENINAGESNPDEGEEIETITMDIQECMNLAYTGKITDSKTLAGLMLYQGHLLKISFI